MSIYPETHWLLHSCPDRASQSRMPPKRTAQSNPADHLVSDNAGSRHLLLSVALPVESAPGSVATKCYRRAQQRNGRRHAMEASHVVSCSEPLLVALSARHLPAL